mmetsp:Transcript_21494/g.15692  ORF Transcript_21494/g.15692 Transcript_21494/m.15692 type:complete len:81 (+) Transcript_21494:616-858(+)
MVGTPYFLAPEAFEGKTGIEGDLWSLGVLIFVLLSGSYPFSGRDPEEIQASIEQVREHIFEVPALKSISTQGLDLMDRLI